MLETLRRDCVQAGADHEVTTNGRKEELGVLGEAKKMIQETSLALCACVYLCQRTPQTSKKRRIRHPSWDCDDLKSAGPARKILLNRLG